MNYSEWPAMDAQDEVYKKGFAIKMIKYEYAVIYL